MTQMTPGSMQIDIILSWVNDTNDTRLQAGVSTFAVDIITCGGGSMVVLDDGDGGIDCYGGMVVSARVIVANCRGIHGGMRIDDLAQSNEGSAWLIGFARVSFSTESI